MEGTIYLIHFDHKYYHAQHYLGWTTNLEQRIRDHQTNQGARLLEIINQVNIQWNVVKTWPGTKTQERQLKNKKHTSRFCPTCKEKGGDA